MVQLVLTGICLDSIATPRFHHGRLQTHSPHRHTQPTPATESANLQDGMIPFSLNISAFDFARRVTAALLFALVLLAMATAARAQQPDDVITTNTSLVQLSVGVMDQQGRAITSVQSNDFLVYEDGVPRPILHFEPADTPFSRFEMKNWPAHAVFINDK